MLFILKYAKVYMWLGERLGWLKIWKFKPLKTFHESYALVMLAIGIIVGTIFGLIFRLSFFGSPVWILLAVIIVFFAILKPNLMLLILALLSGAILALCRISTELGGEDYIKSLYDQTVIVTGTISGDPEADETNLKLKLNNLSFGEKRQIQSAGSLYVMARAGPSDLRQGDEVMLKGQMLAGFGTYAGYLWHPEILELHRPSPGNLVIQLRDWFAERIKNEVPSKEVSLGLSYLLGMKTGLDDDLNENLRTVGLVHIVVASGAHLSILVEIAKKIFGRVSRFSGLLFALVFVGFFMTMVGFTPSILRAGVMTILTLLTGFVGRKMAPWRIILIVMAFTLMLNPMFILNLGWLLSFASFTGIMILGPKLTSFFYKEKKPGFVAETVLTTLAATLLTLPITLYFYGTISLISVVANLIILPTLPYAMGLTFLAGVFSGVPVVHFATGFMAEKMLSFHILVVNFFGGMKSFLIEIPPYNPWIFLLYLVVLVPILARYLYKIGRMGGLPGGGPPNYRISDSLGEEGRSGPIR